MQFTPTRSTTAALLISAMALPALAQTTGNGSAATTQPVQAPSTATAQTGAAQTSTVQTGTVQTGTAQAGAAQTGTAQTGTAQTGTAQAGPAQAGTAQTGTAQSAQGTAAPSASAEGGTAAAGTTQQTTAQTGPAQPQGGAAQTTAAQPTTGESTQGAEQPAGAAAEGEQPAVGSGYAMGDIILGDPDAPVTVIEYASFTCPHCGNFAVQTFPEVKAQYIDTGKVRFILREVYFDQYGLWASMVARCGGEKGFYPLAETFLATQATWTRAPDIGHAIQQVGRRAGLSGERLEQCLSDRDFAKQLLADYQANMEIDKVTSTPTFIIGGEAHPGAKSFEELSELLDAAL